MIKKEGYPVEKVVEKIVKVPYPQPYPVVSIFIKISEKKKQNTFKNIPTGTVIYRNSDAEFNRLVERDDSDV